MDGSERVRVEVLGPLRVAGPDRRDLTPTGALQRRLLALLVLHRGRVVPAATAIEVLWPSDLPRDPTGALQNHMSRLRRDMPAGMVESIGDGYRLDPATIDLDGDRLGEVLGEPTAATSAAAIAALDDVLARWQGPAYPELLDVDEARIEAVRLEELRIRVREARAEHLLARGATDGLVAELTALVEAAPLRERPRALLMATLAATGRTAEALRAYDDFRRLLGDELGIEPSPELVAAHAALLDTTVAADEATGGTRVPDGRLPVPTTSLVGRDQLVADVVELAGSSRLVSLVGPGGVGKTRLLVEVGHLLRAARPERPVVLCELGSADAASVANAVAASLGIDVRVGVPLDDQVSSVLGDAALVLLVDDCEHVVDPVAELVGRLLARCPHLTVVTTSRERLRVPGEQVRPVPVLAIEGDDSPAVRLFLERAGAVVPGFQPDEDEHRTIAEIVRRLDGLPLAIELAAACLHTRDLAEVASGLDRRFALLSSGYRASSRHASLGAAVSWSFGLLDDHLQQVFAALSAFAGSFTVDDAAAVCGTDVETARDALSQLTERSLVMRTPDRRYALLETLRAFGAERLAEAGRSDVVGERHARHLVDWVEQADRRMLRSGRSSIPEIDAALPELHVALGWLTDHGEAELAGRLVASLMDYGFLRLRPDVLAWAERVTPIDPDDASPLAARMWVIAAYAAWMAGDLTETGVRSARALTVAERAGGEIDHLVCTMAGSYELFEGRLDTASRWYRQAVDAAADDPAQRIFAAATEVLALGYAGDPSAGELAEQFLAEVGDDVTPLAAYAWYCAGEAVLEVDPTLARERYARAMEVAERTGASSVTGLAGASSASIDARTGDPELAASKFRALILHWRRAGMWATQWTMLRSIAALLARLGRPREAAVLVGAVLATDEGHRIFGADAIALGELGAHLRAELGDDDCDAALAEGAVLDGDAAVEHALRALAPEVTSGAAPR